MASTTVRPWRLGGRTRKGTLVIHIVSAGAWIGLDVAMAMLVFTSIFTGSARTRALCYQAIELFAVWPMSVSGLICLASGVLLGLGSKYGLVRYWWVAVKLVLNVVLSLLVLFSLSGGVDQLAEKGRRLAAGEAGGVEIGDMLYPAIVSPSALLIASLLSVYKPWGRVRKAAAAPRPESARS